jgi:hypothetical protein
VQEECRGIMGNGSNGKVYKITIVDVNDRVEHSKTCENNRGTLLETLCLLAMLASTGERN